MNSFVECHILMLDTTNLRNQLIRFKQYYAMLNTLIKEDNRFWYDLTLLI